MRKSSLIGTTVRCFTVTDMIPRPGKKSLFLLKCNLCGAVVTRGPSAVRSERIMCDCSKEKVPNRRGTKTKSPLYNSYRAMIARCYNPNNDRYPNYGGRGIKVCDEWQTFPPFEEWAFANGWEPGLTIDRKDVNGDYEPQNCRWADVDTQSNNKSDNRYFTYNGETKTMKQWAKSTGIGYYTLRGRLDRGWSIADALEKAISPMETKSESDRLIEYGGETKLLSQWSRELGIGFSTLRSRLERSKWSVEKAFTTPVKSTKKR